MWNVIGKNVCGNKIVVEVGMTEANALKYCESMDWVYDDGVCSYTLDMEEVKTTSAKENESMENAITREEIIAKVREMGITKEEIGWTDEYKSLYINLRRSIDCLDANYNELIDNVKELIDNGTVTKYEAREVFDKELWEDLGIEEPKFKVVEVKLAKTIYQTVQVVIPNNESSYNAGDYIDFSQIDNDDCDDEEEWEVDDTETVDEDVTAEYVGDNYNTVNSVDDIV